jgi:hypothetical protein
VRVEVGTESFAAVAVPAEGAERDRLFERVVRVAPGFADYQARVRRRLPVVSLERSHDDAGAGTAATLADKLVEIHTWLRHHLRRCAPRPTRTSRAARPAARRAAGGRRG